ncbi:MAG: hypothetical protein ACRC8A_20005 [Microcoleaceae cyanobacterium]
MVKYKLIGGLCALLATTALPLPALAQIGVITVPSDFDYRYKSKNAETGKVEPPKYETLPDLALPDRTLPAKFKYPIIYEMAVNKDITSDAVITDEVFLANLPPVPSGATLDDVPRARAEYTRKIEEWGELIQECLAANPLLIKKDTGNPILINQKPAGTIVFNANLIPVCPR